MKDYSYTNDKPKPFTIYKANKNQTGSALKIDFNKIKKIVFLECAHQKSEDRFDWENKITVKLSPTDISKILEVLEDKSKNIKLFHQPSKGEYKLANDVKNTVVDLSSTNFGYSMRISRQTTSGLKAININISKNEAIIMRILLLKAVEMFYSWQ